MKRTGEIKRSDKQAAFTLPSLIYNPLAQLKKRIIFISCRLRLRYAHGIIHVGQGVTFNKGFKIYSGANNVIIGNNVSLNDVLINAGSTSSGKVVIKDNVFFGHKCMLLARTHDYHVFGIDRIRKIVNSQIVVEQGAWISSGAIVLGGVTIGRDAVIAAGAIVTKNVPSLSVVGGTPARIIKKIHK